MTLTHRPSEKQDYAACRALFQELRKHHQWDGWFQRVVFDDHVDKINTENSRYIQELFFENEKLVGYVRAAHLRDKSQTTVYETLVAPNDILMMKTLLDFVADEAKACNSPRVVAKYTDVPGTIHLIRDLCGFDFRHREIPIKENLSADTIRKPVLAFVKELCDPIVGAYKPKKHPNYEIIQYS